MAEIVEFANLISENVYFLANTLYFIQGGRSCVLTILSFEQAPRRALVKGMSPSLTTDE